MGAGAALARWLAARAAQAAAAWRGLREGSATGRDRRRGLASAGGEIIGGASRGRRALDEALRRRGALNGASDDHDEIDGLSGGRCGVDGASGGDGGGAGIGGRGGVASRDCRAGGGARLGRGTGGTGGGHRARRSRRRCAGRGAALVLLALAGPPALAAPDIEGGAGLAGLCEAAAERAARAEGVPLHLMRAISLAETGRALDGRLAPWPWTVNMEGEGRWFSSPEELLTWVRRRQAQGARSFDLGCFQVNHLWHGAAFESLEEMLDPAANARYAARFLRALRDETGSWEIAAGHYHSRTPELAERYRTRVLRIAAELPDAYAPAAGEPPAPDGAAAPTWWFASISPLDRRPGLGAAPEVDPAADARADATAASLAHAWLASAREEVESAGAISPMAPAGARGGLLRRGSPLFGSN